MGSRPYIAVILTINRWNTHDLPIGVRHSLGLYSGVVKLSIVRTVRKHLNITVPKSKVALEAWLAELHHVAVSDLGSAFLAFQITELENKCAVLRKRRHHKAKPNSRVRKRCALRSAA